MALRRAAKKCVVLTLGYGSKRHRRHPRTVFAPELVLSYAAASKVNEGCRWNNIFDKHSGMVIKREHLPVWQIV